MATMPSACLEVSSLAGKALGHYNSRYEAQILEKGCIQEGRRRQTEEKCEMIISMTASCRVV